MTNIISKLSKIILSSLYIIYIVIYSNNIYSINNILPSDINADIKPNIKLNIKADLKPDKQYLFVGPQNLEFEITVVSNAGSTGFSWYLDKYDNNIITPVSTENINNNQDDELVGAPIEVKWKFKVNPSVITVPQITHIKLINKRAWEVDSMPAAVKVIEVYIDPNYNANMYKKDL